MPRKVRRRRLRVGLGGVLTAAALIGAGASEAAAVTLIRSDLDFMLQQVKIAENHAEGGELAGDGPLQVRNSLFPFGMRTVDGSYNNIVPGREDFGRADRLFPRMLAPAFRPAEALTVDPPGPQAEGQPTSYLQTNGFVEDSQPRVASNLVVDQTTDNPAAVAAAAGNGGAETVDHDGNPATPDLHVIPNRAPDEGLSAPFNSWFTLFGQFFDHGLDLVPKGGSGVVRVPLKPDDPLIAGPDGELGTGDDLPPHLRFMMLTRATNQPGPDGILGTADDVREHRNLTTPFVDQNQTYTSHPSHQVFLREYELDGDGNAVATGRLLDDDPATAGIGTWATVKEQARTMLGLELSDTDVLNVPLLRTDPYGRFIPGPNGYAQVATATGFVEGTEGGLPLPANTLRTNHAFLDDIAHQAVPGNGPYDAALLDAHFITGDGRGNENIGLTAVHHVFHAEHNRMVGEIKGWVVEYSAPDDVAFLNEWLREPVTEVPDDASGLVWNGERLFQAARFATEMQYQHLVFEEFARKVQPQVNVFAGYEDDLDPAIVAEFAHTVYRFGHSMLNETVDRTNADGSLNDMGLVEAFLNPLAYYDGGSAGALTSDEAAGAIVRGMTRQTGNEIDEFVTEALRNNLLGLPLDLATINMARGRDTGVPRLNEARRQFHAGTGHSSLEPYSSWKDFGLGLRNPESLVNFVAAYGLHPTITSATTLADKREAAALIVLGGAGAPADRIDFLDGVGDWADGPNGLPVTGLEDVDFWLGGLAEKTAPFGGMLPSTFNFVFETQMERLQDGDRFYYLTRLAGLNFLTQLEENSFAEIIMRNTDAENLPHDVFSRPDYIFDLNNLGNGPGIADDPATPYDESELLIRMPNGTVRFAGGEHVVMGGTDAADRMRAGDGDDTLWGGAGIDRLEGGAGNDALNGEAGDDIITDLFGDDNIKGGAGDDAIHAGPGLDLILSGTGKDFVVFGSDPKEAFGGTGDDFIMGGDSSDIVFGNEGDDWIEGGNQADLLQGGNQTPFEDDTVTGDDVIIGGGGNDDYDSEGGDDIMVTGPGVERLEGMRGFDWVTHQNDPRPANSDLNRRVLQPPDVDNVRDRFDLVEGMSGWDHDDVLRGDSRGAGGGEGGMEGHELRNPALIDGLQDLLGEDVEEFAAGEIILGGGGSDLIEGRGGNDLIDGDRWLRVQLEAPNPATPDPDDVKRVDSMAGLQQDVFAGRIDPGDIRIVRELVTETPGVFDVDTAEFSDERANYDLLTDPDNPSIVTVVHARGTQADGTDTLHNVERLKFSDETVQVADIPNTPATGAPEIDDMTPVEGQLLTASVGSIADDDGINLGTLTYSWQAEEDPGEWTTVGFSPTFTPTDAEVGLRLRVVATFQDGDGVFESRNSAPTAEVENVNSPPTGQPTISDTTPVEGVAITVLTGAIADGDGLEGVVFARQWQEEIGAGNWVNIAGATGGSFTPTATQVGRRLRVVVSYTDNQGTAEQVLSAPTQPVAAAPAPLLPAPPPSSASTAPARTVAPSPLTLSGIVIPRAVTVSTVATHGVSVRLRTQKSARVVRVRIYRAGGRNALATVFVRVTGGTVKATIKNPKVRRVLARGGTFRLAMTPGTSRTEMGTTTVRRIVVRK